MNVGSLRRKKNPQFSSNTKEGKNWCPGWKVIRLEGLSYLRKGQVSCSFRHSTDWMRVMLMKEGNLLYSVYILNINLIWNHPYKNTQSRVWSNIWALRGPDRLSYKINHHRCQTLSWFYTENSEISQELCQSHLCLKAELNFSCC